MKKHWLLTLGVYCLGVATLPGVLGGVRWWRNSESHAPKFVDIQNADAKTASDISIAEAEPTSFLDEPDLTTTLPVHPRPGDIKPIRKAIVLDDDAVVAEVQPLQLDLDSAVEPPVLAQNDPIRRPPVPAQAERSLDAFDELVPVRPRSAPAAAKPEQPDGIESLAESDLSDEQKAKLTTLREKLAELTKAKAELVNEQTLTGTIASLEKQISNLHAAQKLLSAQQILRALAEEFPDSPAAAKAQRMLEAAGFKTTPVSLTDPLSGRPTVRYTFQ